jgi:hypothetical protein
MQIFTFYLKVNIVFKFLGKIVFECGRQNGYTFISNCIRIFQKPILGQQLIKKTFAGSLECPLYIGLTVYYSYKD